MAEITYTFPEHELKDGTTLQLILTFTNDDTTEEMNPADRGMFVLRWGKLSWDYDIDDPLMVPGTIDMTIFAPTASYAGDVFFPGIENTSNIDPQAEVEIKLNGATEFIGYIIEDSIDWDKYAQTISFKAAPRLDIINKQMVYDEDGNNVNPFSYTNSTYVSFQTLLTDIFGLATSSLALQIIHQWNFHTGAPIETNEIYEIKLLINQLYFTSSTGLNTTGDVLRQLALDFGAFAGMIHGNKAFFKQLFVYDSGNTQELGVIKSHKRGYRYNLIDWVKVEPLGVAGQDREAGTETQLLDKILTLQALAYIYEVGPTSFTSIRSALDDDIIRISNTTLGVDYLDHGQCLADYWHKFRSSMVYTQSDKIVVSGVGYDFLKDFELDGREMQIIGMSKDFDKQETEIEAVTVGIAS